MDSYTFGPAGEYRVLVAADRSSRERALSLVYGVYLAAGLAEQRPSRMLITVHDALPGTTSFLVERAAPGGEAPAAVASLTLIPDGPLGLPIESVAGDALAELRGAGRHPVELAKLATVAATEKRERNRRRPSEEIVLHLFKLAYLAAVRAEQATDMVISVSAHQARFFRRVFLFEPLNGPRAGRAERSLAVPLRLDLTTARQRHEKRASRGAGEHHLFSFFINDQEPEILKWLRRRRTPLAPEDVRYLFAERTQLLRKVDEATRRLILGLYPGVQL
jgi:hypothetical protein